MGNFTYEMFCRKDSRIEQGLSCKNQVNPLETLMSVLSSVVVAGQNNEEGI